MAHRSITVAVIGAGRAGRIHAGNFASRVPGACLVALADPSEQALAEASQVLAGVSTHLDPAEVIADTAVDAVVVATPTICHESIVVAAAKAGKHVLCEKPMAMSVEECERMIAATQVAGTKLQLGFMRRYDSNFIAAKQAIERGDIGDVVCLRSLTHGPSIPKRWQYDISKSNGPLAEVNSHDIDTLRWLTGSEFREVYAMAGNYRCPEAKADFPDFYDNVVMMASFENGMQGVINGAVSVRYGYDARLEVLGSCGILLVGELKGGRVSICSDKAGGERLISRSWRDLFKDAYLAEDESFMECIREDRQPQITGFDGKMAVAVVQAGNRSIRERRPISLC